MSILRCGISHDATECPTDGTSFIVSQRTSINIERLWIPYLVLCSIVSGIGVFLKLEFWQQMNGTMPDWALTTLRFIAFLQPGSLIAIWWGSRSGVVAYIALGFVAMCVCLAIGYKIALGGIIGAIIMIILVRPRWRQMTWGVEMPVDKNKDA